MMSNNKLPVLVAGASGNLGTKIVHALLAREDICVSILVQEKEKVNDLCEAVVKSGGKVIVGDVLKPDTINDVTKGMHTVISTLIGDDDVMIEGQNRLLQDGIKHAIKRFVPSDFSLNIWKLSMGTHYMVDQRLKFRQMLEKTNVKGLHFTDGMFMETYFWLAEKEGFKYWGDINMKMDLTSMDDMAKFVAVAVADKDRVGDVMVSSVEVSTKQIVEIYNKMTGKNVQAKNMGSMDDLKNMIKDMKSKGNTFEAIQLGFDMMIFDGRGKIMKRMNSNFPEVKVMGLEDFLKQCHGKMNYCYTMCEVAKSINKEKLMEYAI